jgi:hypothetical protein
MLPYKTCYAATVEYVETYLKEGIVCYLTKHATLQL